MLMGSNNQFSHFFDQSDASDENSKQNKLVTLVKLVKPFLIGQKIHNLHLELVFGLININFIMLDTVSNITKTWNHLLNVIVFVWKFWSWNALIRIAHPQH